MCYNCGCGDPNDDHNMGHMGVDAQGKAITNRSFEAVSKAFNMNVDESKKNICDLISRMGSVGYPPLSGKGLQGASRQSTPP